MRPMSKLHSLDAMRGILSLIVVAAHSWGIVNQPVSNSPAIHAAFSLAARVAVLCFFCLSGYVITMSLHSNRRRGFDLRAYAFARVRRIVPPLLAVIALTFAAEVTLVVIDADYMPLPTSVVSTYLTAPAGQIFALVTLGTTGELNGYINWPLWSLTFELRLYVVAGLVAALLWSPRKLLSLACLLAYIVAIDLPVLDSPINDWRPLFNRQALCFVAFGLGSAAYLLRGASTRAVLLVMAAALPIAWALTVPNILANIDTPRMNAAQGLLSVALAGLVLLVGRMRGSLMAGAGQYSYTLYIGHFPLLLFLSFVAYQVAPASLSPKWAPLTAACAMAVTWLVLAALGRLVERPALFRRRVKLAADPRAVGAVMPPN